MPASEQERFVAVAREVSEEMGEVGGEGNEGEEREKDRPSGDTAEETFGGV